MTLLDFLQAMRGGPLPEPLLWLASRVVDAADAVGLDPNTAETALHVYTVYVALHGGIGK